MIIIIFLFVLLLTGNIHTGVIQTFNLSNINKTEILRNDNQSSSSINTINQNQFAETVVDILLDLLEKANLSRIISVIHNDLVEHDDDNKTTTIT